jgi:hypothetical protein
MCLKELMQMNTKEGFDHYAERKTDQDGNKGLEKM